MRQQKRDPRPAIFSVPKIQGGLTEEAQAAHESSHTQGRGQGAEPERHVGCLVPGLVCGAQRGEPWSRDEASLVGNGVVVSEAGQL